MKLMRYPLSSRGVSACRFQPSVVRVYFCKLGVAQPWMESQEQADLQVSHQSTP